MDRYIDNSSKAIMSDEERIKLAAKLDKELDEFISGLEKRQYTEGWPEDRWEEEFNKHPFFMKESPKPGDELHPLLEGIQQLKYDPEENTAEELANSYKEDGNFNFKHKNYRLAILSYTEGIKQKHENVELIATLYNNRAAANFFLKNYRSCIRDCEIALKHNPNYLKAMIRAAQSYFHIENWDKCIMLSDSILEKENNEMILQLRQNAVLAKKSAERDLRKRQKEERMKKLGNEKLLNEIKSRGIQITDNNLIPILPQLEDAKVHLDAESNQLIWPVALVYPEIGTIDFIREFYEQNTFYEQLFEVFKEPAAWDTAFRYKIDRINIYFEESTENGRTCIHFVKLEENLCQTLARKEYTVKDATPHFFILEKGSNAELNFLKQYK